MKFYFSIIAFLVTYIASAQNLTQNNVIRLEIIGSNHFYKQVDGQR